MSLGIYKVQLNLFENLLLNKFGNSVFPPVLLHWKILNFLRASMVRLAHLACCRYARESLGDGSTGELPASLGQVNFASSSILNCTTVR